MALRMTLLAGNSVKTSAPNASWTTGDTGYWTRGYWIRSWAALLTCILSLWGSIPATQAQSATAEPESAATAPEAARKKERARQQDEFQGFLRIRKDAKKRPVALETSITRYEGVNDKGERITVDLIGAVHVGEQSYYDALNEAFKKYDACLYELVAPEGTRIPKGGRGDEDEGFNPLGTMQKGMKSMLGLEFQLDHIDYMAENLVHADMSPDEFMESMNMNEESFGKMFLKSIGAGMAQSDQGEMQVDLMLSLFSKDRTKRLRRTMAEQMQDLERGIDIFEGKDGSTIITHRNAKVMEVLQREIAKGKTHIGIFYGAGHLPDMQRRLTSEFRLQQSGRTWLPAWDLQGSSKR